MAKVTKRGSVRLRAEVRKAEIIEAAASLFAAKGFNGTKTREIAKRARVSEALIFKHFPSKGDLYAAILADESPVPRLISQVKELAKNRQDEEVFRAIAKTIVGGVPDNELMRLILFSALESHELSDMFFHNHIRVFYDVLAGYIQQRIDEGVFRKVSPIIAARAFMGMLIYHRLLSVLFQAELPHNAQEISETFVTLMMNGLQVSESRPSSQKGKSRSPTRMVLTKKRKRVL
ncbi:MAG: TetR/AcrR family transcriptional regulator [Nitrospirales bacterium]